MNNLLSINRSDARESQGVPGELSLPAAHREASRTNQRNKEHMK